MIFTLNPTVSASGISPAAFSNTVCHVNCGSGG
jgi:hypothetical protein